MVSNQNTESFNASAGANNSKWALLVPPYIFLYTLAAIWLTLDGWLSGFSSILNLWTFDIEPPRLVISILFTMTGAMLGSSLLGIISFHRYHAIEKSFDTDHLWGFLFSPLLALIVGVLIFAIIQSGLIVLSGDISHATNPESATLGYLAIGGVSGYNWDVFVKKLEELSKNVINTSESTNN
ncbi:hypothetical protein MOV00_004045 [Vibrio vulnificus]|nr:hypothetical protein [Vibrio vulnificus]ELJ8841485.1 hypothetical protein [Vibrio parahaemolyticus]KJQ88264.1 hypothetical protein UG53_03820 [Vibrio sp. S512-13]KJQ90338.1 hypothetical protein UF05_16630 [Vibrio sp. S457-15]EKG2461988.1 hypothetical protein [Vibrio vulnificus]